MGVNPYFMFETFHSDTKCYTGVSTLHHFSLSQQVTHRDAEAQFPHLLLGFVVRSLWMECRACPWGFMHMG